VERNLTSATQSDAEPADRELTTDVLVVGRGASGSGAPLQALRVGARVMVLEKRAVNGGSASVSAGGFWTFEDFEAFRALAPDGDPAMQQKLVDSFPAAVEFLRSAGITVAGRPHLTQANMGISYKIEIQDLLDHALDAVRSEGGSVLLGTAARSLLWNGREVEGVIAVGAGGARLRINARSVALASGGFQGSPEILARYVGLNYDQLLLRSNPGSVGDGFRLASSVAASGTKGMSDFYGHLIASPVISFDSNEFRPLTQYHSSASILVNVRGWRIMDETIGDAVLAQVIVRQPNARGVLVFDDHVRRTDASKEPAPGVGDVDRFAYAEAKGARVACAPTLEALIDEVATWGIERAELNRTVHEYCGAIENRRPFARGVPVASTARAPQTGPYYAVDVRPAITFTFGGIRASVDGEVLDHDGVTIPGLFAGGGHVGGISGVGYAGGLAPCFIAGMWAGDSAARWARGDATASAEACPESKGETAQ
jgi:succinate dehydrogenase/fumarate reductase flavoprotein subunit